MGTFNLLMSARLKWGVTDRVHASGDMKALYYGEFEGTALFYIGGGKVGVWGPDLFLKAVCLW